MSTPATPPLTTVKKTTSTAKTTAPSKPESTTRQAKTAHTTKHASPPDSVDDGATTSPTLKSKPQTPPLTANEQREYTSHVQAIRKVEDNILNAARSMADIQTRQLYRGSYETWPDFFRNEFDMSAARATQLIKFAQEIASLEKQHVEESWIPRTERAIRELRRVKEDEKFAVLKRASLLAEGKAPTSADIAQAREDLSATVQKTPGTRKSLKVTKITDAIAVVTSVNTFLGTLNMQDLGRENHDELKQLAKLIRDTVVRLAASK